MAILGWLFRGGALVVKGVLFYTVVLFSLPLVFLSWATWVNPFFIDRPFSVILLFLIPSILFAFALNRLHPPKGHTALARPFLMVEILIYLFLCLRPTPTVVAPKVLIVGIDGAHWSLVDRFKMPTLQNLKTEGIYGPLLAEPPLFSPLLWTTIATGKPTKEHGIRGFRTQSSDAKSARFWEIAEANGLSVGLYKWLVSWPPVEQKSGGFIVPAWLAPTPETWPLALSTVKEIELSRRLSRRNISTSRSNIDLALSGIPIGFRFSTLLDAARLSLAKRTVRPEEDEMAWALQLLRIQMDRDVFVHQLHVHAPDVASLTLYATDALGHTHWKWLDCQSDCPPYASAVSDAYVQADAVLAEVMTHVDPDTPIVVLSDHGFRPATEEDAGRRFQPKTESLRERLKKYFPDIDAAKLGQKVVISLAVDSRRSEMDRLMSHIDDLVVSETNQPLYDAEYLPDAPYSIGLTIQFDRVTEEQLKTWQVGSQALSDFIRLQEPYSGEHDASGIFVLKHPDFEGQARESIKQIDVLPTLLSILKLAPATDLMGESLIPNPLSPVSTYDDLRVPLNEPREEQVNEEQLRALGYIE